MTASLTPQGWDVNDTAERPLTYTLDGNEQPSLSGDAAGAVAAAAAGSSLAVLVADWDASALPEAVGATVLSLPDFVGGQNLVQPTAANRPVVALSPSGLKALNFVGAKRLTAAGFGGGYPVNGGYQQPLTILVAFKGEATLGTSRVLFAGEAAGQDMRLVTSGPGRVLYAYAGSNTSAKGPNLNDGQWHIAAQVFGASSAQMYIDGYLVSANDTQAQGARGIQQVSLGAYADGSANFDGTVGELMVFSGVLTPAQIQLKSEQLGKKWGVSTGKCSAAGGSELTASPNGQAVRIWAPAVPPNGTALIYAHQRGGSESIVTTALGFGLVVSAQAAGYVTASSNMHGDNWGNATGQADIADLYAMLKARYGVSKLVVVGASMGGLAGLNLALSTSIPDLAGVYLIDGVCSLANMYTTRNAVDYRPGIRTAYGIAGDDSDYASKTAGFDPMLAPLTNAATRRFRFVSSAADIDVPNADNALAMVTRLTGNSAEASSLIKLGTHLDGDGCRPSDLLDFVRRCGG